MLKLVKTEDNPYFQLTRGTSLRQNYIVMHGVDKIYDLHLEFSQNFISGKRLWGSRRDFEIDKTDSNLKKMSEEKFKNLLFMQAQSQMHQKKANYDGSQFLGLRKLTQTQLHRGFSLFDLQYVDYILEQYGLEQKSLNYQSGNLAQPLILEYLNVQLPFNANIVHIYHRSSYFLSNLLRVLTDHMQQIQSDSKNSRAEEICPFLYYSLIPLTMNQGAKGKRGLSMVLKGSHGECFELMVQMLMLDPCGINYMRHIKLYIIKLLSYDSDIVRNFLQSKSSSQLYSLRLSAEQRKKQIGSYLGKNSLYIEFAENEESEKSQAEVSSENNFLQVPIADERDSEDEHQEIEGQERINQELEQHINAQMKEINLYSYDFDGYLVGKRQKLLLSFIIQQENNLKIFDLNYIKIYLDYQWSKLKYRYFVFLLAQIINNILMILYIVIQQLLFNCSEDDYKENFCQNSLTDMREFLRDSKKNKLVLLILRSLLFIFSLLLICLDYIKLKNQKSFLNTFFWGVNIAYLVKQIADIYLSDYFFLQLMDEYRPQNDKTKYLSEIGADANEAKLLENRFLNIPIFIIKATNAFFMLTLPMQFLFRIRYLPGMTIYLPKFFDVIKQIKGLILIFITFSVSFGFSYSILRVLDFKMGALDIQKSESDLDLKNGERNFTILRYVAMIFGSFGQIMIQLILVYGVNITMFIGAAMIKADQKATDEFDQLKMMNLARFIAENEVLINRKKLYENVHYVIHSDIKQEKISSAFDIMNSDEQMDKMHGGAKRQNRKCRCCATILQGQPIELVYEAKQ